VRRRFFQPLALALAVVAGSTGCTLSAEIATMKDYDPSDGVGVTMGDLALRNILLITNDEGTANLVMTVVNSGGTDQTLNVQFENGTERTTASLDIPGAPARTRVGDDPAEGILVQGEQIVNGGLFPLYFEYGDVPGELVFVPVLDGTLPEYELLVP